MSWLNLRHLISETRRRKVFGVAAGYAVVAWAVIEVSGTVLQMASAPAWVARAVLAVVAVGFPVALVIAWFFDLSPAGVVRTAALEEGEAGGGAAVGVKSRGTPLLAAVAVLVSSGLLVAFAIWLRPDENAEVEFTQLTNFAEAATAPALSRDGRMLAFLKGGPGLFGNSATASQVYVKQLPDGEEVQLTSSPAGKATPTFSPDGARVYFTSMEGNFHWSTHVVSVNGGHESELLPNASGLTFMDGERVLFAETREGAHMGVRRGTLLREDVRDVYWPPEDGMAHRAAVSPDGQWVLIVEMDAGVWQRCRLVPLDGSTRGRQVGPPDAQCTYAAWSPDGRWMYFTANAGGAYHIWQQRFPKGEPRQLTNGASEEEGIAVAPDGRSLITSAGVRHNTIRLIDGEADRQISIEGYAFSPVASRDGRRVYYLSRADTARLPYDVGNLVVATLDGNTREAVLPGYPMVHFDISADDRYFIFVSGSPDPAKRGVWLAPLDRSAAPRRIFTGATERAFLDPAGNVYLVELTGAQRYLHRLRAPEYRVDERVGDYPVRYLFSISPDGEWVVGVADAPDLDGLQQVAISTRGLRARVICAFCGGGAGPARVGAPAISWTRDGRAFLVSSQFIWRSHEGPGPMQTVVVPVRPGAALPDLPKTGIESQADYLKVPGARQVPVPNVLPGASPAQLFRYETTTIRNLYRVRLHG